MRRRATRLPAGRRSLEVEVVVLCRVHFGSVYALLSTFMEVQYINRAVDATRGQDMELESTTGRTPMFVLTTRFTHDNTI